MKSIKLILLAILFGTGTIFAQERELVIFEKFSGIDCGACPTAVEHIHTLMESGAQIGVISYQAGNYSHPYYQNQDATNMLYYYSSMITGYPTTIIDGISVPDWNTYDDYEQYYNERISSEAKFDLDIDIQNNGNNNYTVNIENTPLTDLQEGTLKVIITETNIDQIWQGENHLYDICRKMLPDNSGTSFNISAIETYTFDVTLEDHWEADYCSVIAYVCTGDKEIIAASKLPFSDNDQVNDIAIEDVLTINNKSSNTVTFPHQEAPDEICGADISSTIRIRNSGSNTLESATIEYSVNDDDIYQIEWTGSLAPQETEEVELTAIPISTLFDLNMLHIQVSNPNGSSDEDPVNDLIDLPFKGSIGVGNTPSISFRTDEWPFLNRWELKDSEGNIIEESGNLAAYTEYEHTFDLEDGCYQFTIYDETGNGFSNYAGEDGYFIFRDSDGVELVNIVDFGYEWSLVFSTEDVLIVIPSDEPYYEVAESKKALFMNSSANWCTPCGDYEYVFDEIYEDHPSTICSIKAHVATSSIGDPVSGDFHNALMGGGGIPAYSMAGTHVDMWPPNTETLLGAYDEFAAQPVVAGINFSYEIEDNYIYATATAKFFQDAEGEFFINVFILENDIEYEQSYTDGYETTIGKRISRGPFEPNVANMWGDNVGNGTAAAGTTLNAQFMRSIPSSWNQDNLECVAVIWQKNGDTWQALSAEDQPDDFVAKVEAKITEEQINIYPIPADNYVNIEAESEITRIEIVDTFGKLIYRKTVGGSGHRISTDKLNSGLYLVRVHTNKQIINKKLIIN